MPLLEDRGPSQAVRPLTLGGTWNSARTARVGHLSGAPERRLLTSLRGAFFCTLPLPRHLHHHRRLRLKALAFWSAVPHAGPLSDGGEAVALWCGSVGDITPCDAALRKAVYVPARALQTRWGASVRP